MKEILKRRFKQSELKARPGSGNLTSIDAYAVIDRLNEAFGETNWKITVTNTIWETDEVIVFGYLSIWIDSVGIWKHLSTTFGGMKQAFYKNGGDAIHSKADLAKGATTSLIGKSASFLGIGIDVYQGKQTHQTKDMSPTAKYKVLQTFSNERAVKIANGWNGEVKEVEGKKAILSNGIHLLLSPEQFNTINKLKTK